MLIKLFLLFTLIPLIELIILMKMGAAFGIGITLLVVIGTGLFGAYLTKQQGIRVWFRIQTEMNAGRLPASDLIDALLLFAAGVVLITPGLLTDITGFLLLIPITRSLFKKILMRYIQDTMRKGHTTIRYVNDDIME